MKISVVPASTQAGRSTIEALLKHENRPQIRAIYRNISKAPSLFTNHSNFEAVTGGLEDHLDLDFSDSNAVFYVPPPTYDDQIDSGEHAALGAERIKAALRKAPQVQRLVVLSALGAQHSEGIGILKINHITDDILAKSAREVVIVRPGWFQENWVEALESAKATGSFQTHFTPVEHKIAMVSLEDVGSIIADRLLDTSDVLPLPPYAFDLHGPRSYSMLDLQAALEEVTGRQPAIAAIEPDQLLDFFKQKVPAAKAQEIADMTVAINGGGMLAEQMNKPQGNLVRGRTELVDTLRRLGSGEISKSASGAF